jgi:hypothetical protein
MRIMKKIIQITVIILFAGLTAVSGQPSTPAPVAEKAGKAFTGYFNITDMGLLVGSTQNRHPAPFTFMTTNGIHITEQLSLGLGIGVEFLSGSYMPIVLDTRYYIRNTAFSPFFSLMGGYALALDDDGANQMGYTYDSYWPYPKIKPYTAQGGWLLNPGFGIRNMFGENFGIIFSAGYRIQRLYYESGDIRRLTVDYNRLSVKFGIIFR